MLSGHKLVATVIAFAMIIATALFIRYSLWGRQIQAVAQNRLGASLAGIDTTKTSSIIFTLSGGLAALSGALLAPLINASPDVGSVPAIKSYVIVVLGGMGSMAGSIVASLLLGVLESFGAVYISYDYRDTFGLVILILVLLFRPQGLFGQKGREV
jgi:branched-chain amino acid transport system permease protein